MHALPRSNASMQWFMEDLTYRIVAKTGIPSDRHHFGKIIQQSLSDDPNFILQVDGSTGKKETSGSVLQRSTQCAIAMKNFGLKRGGVIAMMVPNHLDVSIALYAALYLGVAIAPIDVNLGVKEIQSLLLITQPQIVFCQNNYIQNVEEAISNAKLTSTSKIVTFDINKQYTDYTTFMEKYGDDTKVKDFKPSDFDTVDTIAFLLMTSGTTGLPKCAALTHTSLIIGCSELCAREYKFPDPKRMVIILSPLQWLSAVIHYMMSPILRYTRLQSPLPTHRQHVYDMINKYRPTHMIASPPLLLSLVNAEEVQDCDFSCFKNIIVGGSAVTKELLEIAKKVLPAADIVAQYGQTEASGFVVEVDNRVNRPPGSIGKVLRILQFRLVDASTQEDIVEANRTGELWLKGPSVFKGYYNEPKRTQEVLTEDGWLKTGDLMYMDEHLNLYFVDRMKMLLKYKNHQVSPVELESVIHQHPGVYDVAVTGIDDFECGDLPVACVVRRPGHDITAQEIKDLVKNSLADTKQLRGGVIFLDQLPITATCKVDRTALKKIAAELKSE